MAFRFRRTIKILPGVRLNVGKKGVSASVGSRGARVTVGADGKKRATVGIPGTGLSYTESSGANKHQTTNESPSIASATISLIGALLQLGALIAVIAAALFFLI